MFTDEEDMADEGGPIWGEVSKFPLVVVHRR